MTQVSARLKTENYLTEITSNGNFIMADEPLDLGGQNKGLDPMALVASGLAACTNITLRMYAQQKGWDLGDLEVKVRVEEIKEAETKTIFHLEIIPGLDIDEDQHKRLLNVANKCPIHKLLKGAMEIETQLKALSS